MVFTREDILKILNALLQLGRKDSEFKDANTPLNNDDEITILLDGINKKVSINNLLSTLGLLKKDDFINVSDRYDEYYIQLSEAITIIANNKRKKGLVITFLDIDGNWRIYLFIGELSNFIITDYWKDLHDFKYPIINTILPDEEDLTLTPPNIEGNSFIKLKDKEYNLDNFSGLGKVILRKNIVEVEDPTYGKIKKNILYQDMINESNTIYVIQYDFTLGEDITVPENCVLEFDGGSLNNCTITGQNTIIKAGVVSIFTGITISGTWNVEKIHSEWFSDINEENKINNLIALCRDEIENEVFISDNGSNYLVAADTYDKVGFLINKKNTIINLDGTIKMKPNGFQRQYVVEITADNVTLQGSGKIIGEKDQHDYSTAGTHEWGHGLSIVGNQEHYTEDYLIRNIKVNGIEITNCTGDCIMINHVHDSNITNVFLHDARRQGISVTSYNNNLVIEDFVIEQIKGTAPQSAIDVEPDYGSTNNIIIRNGRIGNVEKGILLYKNDVSSVENISISNIVAENLGDTSYNFSKGVISLHNAKNVNASSIYGLEGTTTVYGSAEDFIIKSSKFGIIVVDKGNLVFDSCTFTNAGTVMMAYSCNIKIYNSVINAGTTLTDAASSANIEIYNSILTFKEIGNITKYIKFCGCTINVSSLLVGKGIYFDSTINLTAGENDKYPSLIKQAERCIFNITTNITSASYNYLTALSWAIEFENKAIFKNNTVNVLGSNLNCVYRISKAELYFENNNVNLSNKVKDLYSQSVFDEAQHIKNTQRNVYGSSSIRPKKMYVLDVDNAIVPDLAFIGFQYFDTTLGKPIFVSAIATDGTITWVDSLGNAIDAKYPKVIGTPTNGNLTKFNGTNIEDAGVAPQV